MIKSSVKNSQLKKRTDEDDASSFQHNVSPIQILYLDVEDCIFHGKNHFNQFDCCQRANRVEILGDICFDI